MSTCSWLVAKCFGSTGARQSFLVIPSHDVFPIFSPLKAFCFCGRWTIAMPRQVGQKLSFDHFISIGCQ